MIKIVAVGWRGSRDDLHGDSIRNGLSTVQEYIFHGHLGDGTDDVLVLCGDNPNGGGDAIIEQWVTSQASRAAGWRWESRRGERKERLPGSGVADYRKMMRDRDVDLLMMFPGPNDTESREAMSWAIRYGVPFLGFPIEPETWGGRK